MKARRWLTVGAMWALVACGADTEPPDADERTAGEAAMDEAVGDAMRPTPEESAAPAPGAAEPTPEELAGARAPAPAPETLDVAMEPDAEESVATEPASETSRAETSRYDRLYTIQIAAYLDGAEAERLVSRLRGRGLPVWTAQAMIDGTNWTRVRIGASPSLSEARELGSWITRQYESPVWVAPVDQMAEPVPVGAVDETRGFLSRQ